MIASWPLTAEPSTTAPTLTPEQIAEHSKADLSGIRIIQGDTYSIIAGSEAAIVASGTATLETALLGCPMVIVYKVSPLTYMLGRMLITGVSSIGRPRIAARASARRTASMMCALDTGRSSSRSTPLSSVAFVCSLLKTVRPGPVRTPLYL